MGHSMGAGLSAFFTSVFPERVERLVMLDLVGFAAFPAEKLSAATRKSVSKVAALSNQPCTARIGMSPEPQSRPESGYCGNFETYGPQADFTVTIKISVRR